MLRSNTIMELVKRLDHVRKMIENLQEIPQKTSIKSGTELFLRFTTLMVHDILHYEASFDRVKLALVERGADCIKNMKNCREKAANESKKFIPDSACILTHGHSRAVIDVLKVNYYGGGM
jgi:translation initiation factor 2B subunit (eIF-2B alpha/beta/delta family)